MRKKYLSWLLTLSLTAGLTAVSLGTEVNDSVGDASSMRMEEGGQDAETAVENSSGDSSSDSSSDAEGSGSDASGETNNAPNENSSGDQGTGDPSGDASGSQSDAGDTAGEETGENSSGTSDTPSSGEDSGASSGEGSSSTEEQETSKQEPSSDATKQTETEPQKETQAPTEKPTEAPTEKPVETEKPTEAPTEKPTEPETLPDETLLEDIVFDPEDDQLEQPDEETQLSEGSSAAPQITVHEETETETETLGANVSDGGKGELYIAVHGYPVGDLSKNEKVIYRFLRNELGLNKAAAAGVLSNMYFESGFSSIAIGDGGTSLGLCQWHAGRCRSLMGWCKQHDLDYRSVEGQLKYLEYELKNAYSGVLGYLYGCPDTAEGAYRAGYYFCMYFESPDSVKVRSEARGTYAKNSYYPSDLDKYLEEELDDADDALIIDGDVDLLDGDSLEDGLPDESLITVTAETIDVIETEAANGSIPQGNPYTTGALPTQGQAAAASIQSAAEEQALVLQSAAAAAGLSQGGNSTVSTPVSYGLVLSDVVKPSGQSGRYFRGQFGPEAQVK